MSIGCKRSNHVERPGNEIPWKKRNREQRDIEKPVSHVH